MTPSRPVDEIFTLLTTPNPAEVVVRQAVCWRDMPLGWRPQLNSKYRDLPGTMAEKVDPHLWGDYELVEIKDAPHPYHYYFYAAPKTEEEALTPWRTVRGKARHYEWPAVLHGIAFAEDTEFPIEQDLGQGFKIKRPRLVSRPILTVSTFCLCETEIEYFLSPRPFTLGAEVQPAPSEVRWQVDGGEERLTCLHDDLWLPAEGKSWSLKYSVGQIEGSPSERRFFPATPMTNWQPFIVSKSNEQLETGLWEMKRERIYPPRTGELSGF